MLDLLAGSDGMGDSPMRPCDCDNIVHESGCDYFADIEANGPRDVATQRLVDHVGAEAVATVERAQRRRNGEGEWWIKCRMCGQILWATAWKHQLRKHHPDCPIPALGARLLRQVHWYERRWCQVHRAASFCGMIYDCGEMNDRYEPSCCEWDSGHDDGIHEPREGEL